MMLLLKRRFTEQDIQYNNVQTYFMEWALFLLHMVERTSISCLVKGLSRLSGSDADGNVLQLNKTVLPEVPLKHSHH